jgi:hypothetical protein
LYAHRSNKVNEVGGRATVGQPLRIRAIYLTQQATIRSSGTRDNLLPHFMALYQGTTSQAAEELIRNGTKRQGTTSVVP